MRLRTAMPHPLHMRSVPRFGVGCSTVQSWWTLRARRRPCAAKSEMTCAGARAPRSGWAWSACSDWVGVVHCWLAAGTAGLHQEWAQGKPPPRCCPPKRANSLSHQYMRAGVCWQGLSGAVYPPSAHRFVPAPPATAGPQAERRRGARPRHGVCGQRGAGAAAGGAAAHGAVGRPQDLGWVLCPPPAWPPRGQLGLLR